MKTYRPCSCPIHVEGKCGDRFLRQSLHTTNWQRAQKLTVEAEARGSWDPLPEEAQAAPITIAEATARFLKDAETGRRLSEATLRKYRLMFKHLDKFAAKKGFLYLKQLDLNALREFRESWELGPRTAMKKLERVKGLEVTGTLGILVRAAQRHLLVLREAVDRLKRTNFRFRHDILDPYLGQQGDNN